jgi:hypothetical protein
MMLGVDKQARKLNDTTILLSLEKLKSPLDYRDTSSSDSSSSDDSVNRDSSSGYSCDTCPSTLTTPV